MYVCMIEKEEKLTIDRIYELYLSIYLSIIIINFSFFMQTCQFFGLLNLLMNKTTV